MNIIIINIYLHFRVVAVTKSRLSVSFVPFPVRLLHWLKYINKVKYK